MKRSGENFNKTKFNAVNTIFLCMRYYARTKIKNKFAIYKFTYKEDCCLWDRVGFTL